MDFRLFDRRAEDEWRAWTHAIGGENQAWIEWRDASANEEPAASAKWDAYARSVALASSARESAILASRALGVGLREPALTPRAAGRSLEMAMQALLDDEPSVPMLFPTAFCAAVPSSTSCRLVVAIRSDHLNPLPEVVQLLLADGLEPAPRDQWTAGCIVRAKAAFDAFGQVVDKARRRLNLPPPDLVEEATGKGMATSGGLTIEYDKPRRVITWELPG